MRRIVWSVDARIAYRDIIAWIARDNPQAAGTVAVRIGESIQALAFMPTGRKGRVSGTYEKVVTGLPYIITQYRQPVQQPCDTAVVCTGCRYCVMMYTIAHNQECTPWQAPH